MEDLMDDRSEPRPPPKVPPSHLGQPIPQEIGEVATLPVSEVSTPRLEERFANWGTD